MYNTNYSYFSFVSRVLALLRTFTTRILETNRKHLIQFCVSLFIGFTEGVWNVLEPVMLVEVNCPAEYQGPTMQCITKRNGVIIGTDANEGYFTLYCEVRWA